MRLTIGIPTVGTRPGLLRRAIASALALSPVKARILVADQSGDDRVLDALGHLLADPMIRHVRTHDRAGCLWDNWIAAAANADTEFFAWLQDDDVVAPHFGHRIVAAFDAFPAAQSWIARLGVSATGGTTANWWQATGPMVPMDLVHGHPSLVRGSVMASGAYYTSHALSPGVAFRANAETIRACRNCPRDCDLFVERSILAELGALGPVVCDPALVGYWIIHEGNESQRQIRQTDTDGQYRSMLKHIDGLMDRAENWHDAFGSWALLAGGQNVKYWLDQTGRFAGESRHLDETRKILGAIGGVRDEIESGKVRDVVPSLATDPRPRRAERAVRVQQRQG